MPYYITYGDFQYYLKEYYEKTGNRMQFPEMTNYLYCKGLLSSEPLPGLPANKMYGSMPDEDFDKVMDSFVLSLAPNISSTPKVDEALIIPQTRDVFIIRHPRYTRLSPHIHNYFEVDFVASGQCIFVFENEKRTMKTGELCIIAPHSRHDLVIDDESTVFCIMLRRSTFNTTFFSLMSQKNLLSYFFRTILQGDSHSNYLLILLRGCDLAEEYDQKCDV